MITQLELFKLLNYNPYTGIFTWIISTGRRNKFGNIAGSIDYTGYVRIGIDGKRYLAHRLAYLFMTGECPIEIDHIDLNRSNNIWDNLREATRTQNFGNQRKQKSNTSGVKGVSWHKSAKKWVAQIQVKGIKINLGKFLDKNDAAIAYENAAIKYFGEYARW